MEKGIVIVNGVYLAAQAGCAQGTHLVWSAQLLIANRKLQFVAVWHCLQGETYLGGKLRASDDVKPKALQQ